MNRANLQPRANPGTNPQNEIAIRALNSYLSVAERRGYKKLFRAEAASAKNRLETSEDSEISYGREWKQREPKSVEVVLNSVLESKGWVYGLSMGALLDESRWEEMVGPDIAQHASIEKFENNVLTLSADSSAWATQLRVLSPQIITRIHEVLGQNIISQIRVSGPSQKNWTKGKRSVKWRGPRDTYG